MTISGSYGPHFSHGATPTAATDTVVSVVSGMASGPISDESLDAFYDRAGDVLGVSGVAVSGGVRVTSGQFKTFRWLQQELALRQISLRNGPDGTTDAQRITKANTVLSAWTEATHNEYVD
jgi:hypothetical protein